MTFTRFRRTAGALAALAATLLFQTSGAGAAGQGPLHINFQKCAPDGGPFGWHYEGTVDGDLGAGDINFTFVSVGPGPVIWQFSGVYTITLHDPTEIVISAFAAGIDNLQVGFGHDVLNGVVIAGEYVGARVQVRAHDSPDGNCSAGTITITPSK